MNFIGTRGGSATAARAIIEGYAPHGGLYAPETFPALSRGELDGMLTMSYPERAAEILFKFFGEYGKEELLSACEKAYGGFEGGDPVPLVMLDDGVFMLELWHGPTLAYCDLSFALMPYLIKRGCELSGVNEKILALLPTSGDSGKSAMECFKGEDIRLITFYPHDGISKFQKLQLCTQEGENVRAVPVRGGYEACRREVAKIFSDPQKLGALREEGYAPMTCGSENIARIIPQIACYFSAYLDLVSGEQLQMGEEFDLALPAGNFSNAISAYYAKKMGLPVRRIHCASNLNCALCDFLKTGVYDVNRELYKTTSPSMDILAALNIERLIFETSGRDTALTARRLSELGSNLKTEISAEELKVVKETFDGGWASEETSVEAMYDVFVDVGYTMDTHTGCAMKVAQDWFEKNKQDNAKMVIVSTANPYKFPQDVLYAVTGNDVKDSFKGIKRLFAATAMEVPKRLMALRDKPVRFTGTLDCKKIFDEALAFARQK